MTPDFRLRAWAGARFLGEERWAGRTTDRRSWHLPLEEAFASGPRRWCALRTVSGAFPWARQRIRLKLQVPSWRYHVALVDPIPAGLELSHDAWIACGPVFEHTGPRDDRVEAFASNLPGGSHECRYTARATTAGSFTVAPATAEEMYAPETFGQSASERFVVEVAE